MKKGIAFLLLVILPVFFSGCKPQTPQVVATTRPVYDFTSALCDGTDISVGLLVTENVSCLHDYTLQVSQMQMVESAEVVILSGVGLEDFLGDVLTDVGNIIDSSEGCHLHGGDPHDHEDHGHAHSHTQDPHIWLSPENAKIMVANICAGLTKIYPQYAGTFAANWAVLTDRLDALQQYGNTQLADLGYRELITFHDGFGYFAESFDLTILEAIEEESGSEASAKELKHLITLVNSHGLPAVFTEENGSVSAAEVICAETGITSYTLSMAMGQGDYFEVMYRNIDTVKEALE